MAELPLVLAGPVLRRFGVNLHAVVVDVEVIGLPPLSRHCYDVVVNAGGESKGLKSLGMLRDARRGNGAVGRAAEAGRPGRG